MLKKISLFFGIIVAFCAIFASGWKLDMRWCQADDIEKVTTEIVGIENHVNLVDLRLEQKIVQDKIQFAIQGQWRLQDRHGFDITKYSPDALNLFRQYEDSASHAEQELDDIRERMRLKKKG